MSPAWLAAIVQAPVLMRVTWLALTVQTAAVREVNITDNPDEALALRVTVEVASVVVGIAANAIV